MALIKCSECGKDVSENSKTCPSCGNPISAHNKNNNFTKKCGVCTLLGCLLGVISFIILFIYGIQYNIIYILTVFTSLVSIGGLIDDFQKKRKNKLMSILTIILSIGLVIYIITAIQVKNQKERERKQLIENYINKYLDY